MTYSRSAFLRSATTTARLLLAFCQSNLRLKKSNDL
jgi:hypothetical protein